MRKREVCLVVCAVLAASCGGQSTTLASPSMRPAPSGVPRLPGSGSVRWSGGANVALADLKLEALAESPDAMLEVRIERATGSHSEHGHAAGFVYQLSGTQRLVFADRSADLQTGEAALIAPPGLAHEHQAEAGATWLFISVGDAARAISRSEHGAMLYESAPLAKLPTGTHPGGTYTLGYTETLRRLELDAGAKSATHTTAGYEFVHVLDGKIEVRSDGAAVALAEGGGHVIAPGHAVQLTNTGSEPARALVFFVTPGGEPFEVDLSS
jgi:quercetin dioxygenase-like cupin family protein